MARNKHSKKNEAPHWPQWAPPPASPTGNQQQPEPQSSGIIGGGPIPPTTPPPKNRRRIFMWFFLAIQAIFIIWLVVGLTSAAQDFPECAGLTGDALDLCEAEEAGAGIGTTIGASLIIILWAVTDIILGITYAIIRLARR
ncbi:hypothetical protein ABZX62_26725 [Streptomyces flavidovirens]|uniref:hypothetical protein n=1 Tax=Streptomyces flavidovirens TaxID=67298 RepID=UPI0033A7825A